MGYQVALTKAWQGLSEPEPPGFIMVRFLADRYKVDFSRKKLVSLSDGAEAQDFLTVIILHYLARRVSSGLPVLSGEWLNFKELAGIEGYYAAFRKRAIEPIVKKYGLSPEAMLAVLRKLPARRASQGEPGIIIEALEGVAVLVMLWQGDEEFVAEANMLFDKNIRDIFCVEDIVVLAGFIAAAL